MKKEIFTENTKNTDSSKFKIKISIVSGITVVLLAVFVCSVLLFANETRETATDPNPYNLPAVQNEQIENIPVSQNETFLAHLYVDGKYYTESFRYSDNATAMDLINSTGIVLSEEDSVSCSSDTLLTEDSVVSINRVYYEDVVSYETVAYQTEAVKVIYATFANKVGTETPGSNGKKEIVTRTKFVDGEAVEKSVISEKIVKKPVSAKVYIRLPN